jgi:hypothetical protein
MKSTTPKWLDELDLIDLTVKKFTQPKLCIDTSVLRDRMVDIDHARDAALAAAGVDPSVLLSDAKFKEALMARGLDEKDVPIKPSLAKGQTTAFAKTDAAMKKLGQDPRFATLVKARLLFKSSQEQTRIQRFLDVAEQTDGRLHVPLLYYGAHPGRFSGSDKLNLQNLARGGVLRQSLVAPDGYKIVAADLAQIEARITACLAGQWDLVDEFRRGEDVYSNFASVIYGYRVTEDTHPSERFVGKTGILSLGYQSGSAKYCDTMNNVFGVAMTEQEAKRIVDAYRQRYKKIVGLWYAMGDLIRAMHNGVRTPFGPLMTDANKIILPNGMPLTYHDLSLFGEASYWNGRARVKLYGGKLVENCVQALARIVMTTAELRLARRGLKAVLSVHDELVFCVKEEIADTVADIVQKVMSHKVSWMPELPVKCKAKIGNNYGECK